MAASARAEQIHVSPASPPPCPESVADTFAAGVESLLAPAAPFRDQAIKLYVEQRLSARKVAAVMGLPSGTVRKWIEKAGVGRSGLEAQALRHGNALGRGRRGHPALITPSAGAKSRIAPATDAELIAAYIAKHGVTKCPPCGKGHALEHYENRFYGKGQNRVKLLAAASFSAFRHARRMQRAR